MNCLTKQILAIALSAAACVGFAAPVSAGWKLDGTGWKYIDSAGNFVRDEWRQIDGHWYCFGGDGRMKTGWQQWGGSWYYLTPVYAGGYPEGAMLRDAEIVSGGKLYKLDLGGRMEGQGNYCQDGFYYRADADGSILKRRLSDLYSFTVPEGWRFLDWEASSSRFRNPIAGYLLYPEACQAEVDRGEMPSVFIQLREAPASPESWNSIVQDYRSGMAELDAGEALAEAYEFESPAEAEHAFACHKEFFEQDGTRQVSETLVLGQDHLLLSTYFQAENPLTADYQEAFREFAASLSLRPEEEAPVVLENRYGNACAWEYDGAGYYWYDWGNGTRRGPGWLYWYGGWYYLGEDGYRRSGWLTLDSDTYYLKEDGRMLADTAAQIEGQLCVFGPDGRLTSRQPFALLHYDMPEGWAASDGSVNRIRLENGNGTSSLILLDILPSEGCYGGYESLDALEKAISDGAWRSFQQGLSDRESARFLSSRRLEGAAAGDALEVIISCGDGSGQMLRSVFLLCYPGEIDAAIYTAPEEEYRSRIDEVREFARSIAPQSPIQR